MSVWKPYTKHLHVWHFITNICLTKHTLCFTKQVIGLHQTEPNRAFNEVLVYVYLSLYAVMSQPCHTTTIHESNTCPAWTIHESNLEQLLVFEAPSEDDPRVKCGTTPRFSGYMRGGSRSRTTPTHGHSLSAIENNSYMDIATTRPTRPRGDELVKIMLFLKTVSWRQKKVEPVREGRKWL